MSALTGELIDADAQRRARHDELMAHWAAGLHDSCIAWAAIRREQTFKALGFDTFTAFSASLKMSPTTSRRTANAGDILARLTPDARLQVGHVDVLRPILEIASENQTEEVRGFVVKKQANIVMAALAESRRSLVPLTAELMQTVARRFGVLPKKEYQQRQRERRNDMLSPDQLREQARDACRYSLATLAFYDREIRDGKLFSIEELRSMPGFADALMLLVDSRDT